MNFCALVEGWDGGWRVGALFGEPTSFETDRQGESVTWNYECPGPCLAWTKFRVFFERDAVTGWDTSED